jgi:site-specific recombinase
VVIGGLTIATPRALAGHNFHSRSKASRTNRVRSFGVLTKFGLLWLIAFSGTLENSQTLVCGFFAWRHSYSPVEKRRLYHCVTRKRMKVQANHVISVQQTSVCRQAKACRTSGAGID